MGEPSSEDLREMAERHSRDISLVGPSTDSGRTDSGRELRIQLGNNVNIMEKPWSHWETCSKRVKDTSWIRQSRIRHSQLSKV